MSETALTPQDLLRISPQLWAATYGQVRDPSGRGVPFRLNVLQRRIFALYESRFRQLKPVRGIGLKPRKRGFSTAVAALHYWQLSNNAHEGVTIGDKLDTSDIVFRMVSYFAENDSFGGWPKPSETTTERIGWAHGARSVQGTARGKATCRGMTPQFMHLTEAAHFEKAEDAMDAAMNAVPDDGFNVVFIESTPFGAGEPFALSWEKARWPTKNECPDGLEYWRQWESFCPDSEGGDVLADQNFVRVFAAWFEFEESIVRLDEKGQEEIRRTLDARSWYAGEARLLELYGNEGPKGLRLGREVTEATAWEQLAWRRLTIQNKCRGSIRVFQTEHPSDPQSCFMSAGRQVFDQDALDRLDQLARTYLPETGHMNDAQGRSVTFQPCSEMEASVLVWEKPVTGRRYLLVVDPAEGEDQTKGEDPDRHSVLVLRDEFRDEAGMIHLPRLVARVKAPCRIPMVPLARLVRSMSVYYGRCPVLPEMNNSGMALITALRMLPDPPSIWQRSEFDPHSGRERRWDGWRTTDTKEYGGLRATVLWHLHEQLREGRLNAACPHLISELRAFVDKDGRMEAGSGHDDDVLALAIGLYNIGSAQAYALPVVATRLPPDLAKEKERQQRGRLAMRS